MLKESMMKVARDTFGPLPWERADGEEGIISAWLGFICEFFGEGIAWVILLTGVCVFGAIQTLIVGVMAEFVWVLLPFTHSSYMAWSLLHIYLVGSLIRIGIAMIMYREASLGKFLLATLLAPVTWMAPEGDPAPEIG